MIRICFIINNLKMGGAERQFVELIKYIDKKIFSVTLFLFAENTPLFYTEVESIENITIIKNTLNGNHKILKILLAIFRIRRFLKNTKYDIVQTTLVMNGAIVRLAVAGIVHYKNRIVASIRNNFDNYSIYEKFIEVVLIRNSYTVINTKYSTMQFSKYCRGKYNSKIFHIYNGYNTSKFRRKIGATEKHIPIIGNVGRMENKKNQIQILRAILISKVDTFLYIVGDSGPASVLLDSYIHKNKMDNMVRLISNIQKIEECYNKFDIFILSSLFEGCPNVLFEAMLTKCLCIISDSSNTDSFIQHNVNGLVYNNSDKGLADCIKYATKILRTNKGKNIIQNGYEYAIKNFSTERMIEGYSNLYTHILN